MKHYCSLWDAAYCAQGVALLESLKRHSSEEFFLFVLPLDDECERILADLKEPDLVYLDKASREKFETILNLGPVKASRTWQEWAWTCASNLAHFLMDNFQQTAPLPSITYLDADMLFFNDPAPIFEEIGYRSIAITPHRLIPSKKHLERNGLYNVGFVSFRNTRTGRECLSKWAAQTRERCSADYGCGDQFYLNEWPYLYGDECHIIENIGVNAGPWSIGNWKVTEGPCLDGVPLVLYHAHEYLHDQRLTNYELRPEDIQFIYKPYVAAVQAAKERVHSSVHIST